MRITQENQAILQRIQLKEPFYNHLEWAQSRKENKKYMRQHCVHPPPGTKKKESKFAKQLRGQVGNKGSATSRGPAPRRHQVKESGAATSREYRSEPPASHRAANPENRVNHALELMRADDMRLLLGMKRPPEIVKKVFAALMIVVSPFDTTESDISWEAVHEWVRQLHGVDSFLDNLNHFGSTQIAPPIVQNTLDFLSHADLFPAKVKAFSGALATLCTWIWSVCESSQPQLTQAYRQQHKGYLPSDAQYEGGDDYQRAIEEEVEGGGWWFVKRGAEVTGPHRPSEMRRRYLAGKVTHATLVRFLIDDDEPAADEHVGQPFSELQELCSADGPPFMHRIASPRR